MPDTEPKGEGVFSPVRRMFDTVLGLVQSRIRLFAVELEAEKLRLLDSFLQLAMALIACGVGLMLGASTLALFAWERARYAGLILVTALFLGIGFWMFWRFRRGLRQAPKPFAKTLAEFNKDRACLTGKD